MKVNSTNLPDEKPLQLLISVPPLRTIWGTHRMARVTPAADGVRRRQRSVQCKAVDEIIPAFHDSVDDYLDFCAQLKQAPEKPFTWIMAVLT